jgi:hypothetical protein
MLTSLLTRSLLITSLVLASFAATPLARAAGPGPTGSRVDKTFGNGGHVIVSTRGHGAHQMPVDGVAALDGSLYAVIEGGRLKKQGNWAPIVSPDHWYVIHYTKRGRVDRGFGDHGSIRAFPVKTEGPPGVTVDAKGRLLLSSFAHARKGTRNLLFRYSKRGKLDKHFSGDGMIEFDDPTANAAGFPVPTSDGGAWYDISDGSGLSPVTKLSDAGAITSKPIGIVGEGRCVSTYFVELAAMSDGTAIVKCNMQPPGSSSANQALLRVREDGSLVSDWADHGRLLIDAEPPGGATKGPNASHGIGEFREGPGGSLTISVYASKSGDNSHWTARLTPSGAYDATYGTGGSTLISETFDGDLEGNSVDWSSRYPQDDGSWIISNYSGDDDGYISASKVSIAGAVSTIFVGRKSAFIPGEVNNPPPVPTEDGKALYGFLDPDIGKHGHEFRALFYRLKLGA